MHTEACKVVYNELEMDSLEKDSVIRTHENYRPTISRVKKGTRGNLPKSIEECIIPGHLKQYEHYKGYNNNFLLADDGIGNNRILIFGTIQFIQLMANCDKLWGDGTFKQAPKLWYQMYSIHGYYEDQMIPFVYCLLPNKYETTYAQMLKLISDKVQEVTSSAHSVVNR